MYGSVSEKYRLKKSYMGKSHSKQTSRAHGKVAEVDPNHLEDVDLAARKVVEASPEEDLSSMVKISMSGKDLGRSGYYCVVAYERIGQEPWTAIGFTEISPPTENPIFAKSLVTRYYFENPQKIRLYLYRLGSDAPIAAIEGSKAPDLPTEAVMVSAIDCVLAQAIAGVDGSLSLKASPKGELNLVVEEVKKKQTRVFFDVNIDSVDPDGTNQKAKIKKHSLYLTIHRTLEDMPEDGPRRRSQILRSETKLFPVGKDGLVHDVEWKGLSLSVHSLSKGESLRPLTLGLWLANSPGEDRMIGSAETSLGQLNAASKDHESHEGIKFIFETCKAEVFLSSVRVERNDSFLDYIAGGLEISLFVAIDFTKSNKEPDVPGSLHHTDTPDNPNDYVKAIKSVADILQYYDSDKLVPVYGFGARLPPSFTHCSHCFACNGDYFSPEVGGLDAIIQTYRKALNAVVLHGPTNFHDIVRLVADFAGTFADPAVDKQKYAILLIITDGVITDMKQTINEVVRAADFPMSIVIVGVGEEDFGLMKMLDADDQKLYSTEERRFASRDIVQFVPFNKYKDSPLYQLASETLAEIPREVVGYFSAKDIYPKSDRSSLVASQLEESFGQQSDLVKQLENSKIDFIQNFIKENPDMDEFETYKILNEDKTPSIDPAYFADLVNKAPRGTNVFSLPRPSTPESLSAKGAAANNKANKPFASSSLAKSALPGSAESPAPTLKRAPSGASPTRSIIFLDFNEHENPSPSSNSAQKKVSAKKGATFSVVDSDSTSKTLVAPIGVSSEALPVVDSEKIQTSSGESAQQTPGPVSEPPAVEADPGAIGDAPGDITEEASLGAVVAQPPEEIAEEPAQASLESVAAPLEVAEAPIDIAEEPEQAPVVESLDVAKAPGEIAGEPAHASLDSVAAPLEVVAEAPEEIAGEPAQAPVVESLDVAKAPGEIAEEPEQPPLEVSEPLNVVAGAPKDTEEKHAEAPLDVTAEAPKEIAENSAEAPLDMAAAAEDPAVQPLTSVSRDPILGAHPIENIQAIPESLDDPPPELSTSENHVKAEDAQESNGAIVAESPQAPTGGAAVFMSMAADDSEQENGSKPATEGSEE